MSEKIENLLQSYPKTRPPLSPAHQAIYVRHHQANRRGKDPAQAAALRLEMWMHRQIAEARRPGDETILEIGAGTLNHIDHEKDCRRYEVVEPFGELYAGSSRLSRVAALYGDIGDVPEENRYHRILSVAVLEHLTDLPAVVARSAKLLAPNGIFQAGIPSEGGFLWSLAWRCTTGVLFRLRTGLSYGSLMRYEHVNSAGEICRVIRHIFESVKVRRFPLSFHNLSLYTYLEASGPRKEVCDTYLHGIANERR
ncbi:MAG: class I SAM-dependent methyltransferase [Acidobacteria bacterium]|nr:class I SAM-dependent methyltransferase [Acidobacteriota bacterium]